MTRRLFYDCGDVVLVLGVWRWGANFRSVVT
jgi:hypothetical protein